MRIRKLLKRFLVFLGALVLLGVLAALAAPHFIDPAKYLTDIQREILEATGLRLESTGRMRLKLLPWVGVDTGPLDLSDPMAAPGTPPLLSLDNARIRLRYAPLLQGTVELDSARVEGLRFRMELGADQAARPSSTPGAASESAPAEARSGQDAGTAESGMPLALPHGLELKDSMLVLTDQGETVLELRVGDMETGPVDLAQDETVLNLELAASLLAPRQGLATEWELTGQVVADSGLSRIRLDNMDLALTLAAQGLPPSGLMLRLTGGLAQDVAAQRLEVRDLVVTAKGARMAANATLDLSRDAVRASGNLDLSADPRELLQELGQEPPQTADPDALRSFSLGCGVEYDGQALRLADLRGTLDGTTLSGSAQARLGGTPQVTLRLRADRLDLDGYLPPDTESRGQEDAATDLSFLAAPAGVDLRGAIEVEELVVLGESIRDLRWTLAPVPGAAPLEDNATSAQ